MNDRQPTGQNHEDVDWHPAIQAYLLEHPRARAIDIAAAVGCTEAVALSFLSEQIWRIPAADLPKVLAEIKNMGTGDGPDPQRRGGGRGGGAG